MGLGNFLRNVAGIVSGFAQIARAMEAHQWARSAPYIETELVFTEKAVNVALRAIEKPNARVQDLSVKFFPNKTELRFSLRGVFGDWISCRLPLHVAELTVVKNESVAVVERAGKLRIASESPWRLFYYQLVQAYLNSRFGERRLLKTLAESVDCLSVEPSFHLCGKAVRPIGLNVNIEKILRQKTVASILVRHGIMNVVGISGLREEEGQFVVNVIVGNKRADDWRSSRRSQAFFDG
ncbi:MAG: hypothetical protein NZM06_06205 [Chloroherpetonaceae bacterium]|nr:hypothetical protein [Chloroherpetonaceae bacterium]MDW8437496.1 hypothetical protein [Chloroherpetonaceae bacterium]